MEAIIRLVRCALRLLKNLDTQTVFCTCNEASSVRVVENIKPTHLIIDEAAMATEPEAMIPVQLADHVILIGDHQQLQVIRMSPMHILSMISLIINYSR